MSGPPTSRAGGGQNGGVTLAPGYGDVNNALTTPERASRVCVSQGGHAMPVYEYHCDKCDREVTLTLTISEHEKGQIKCPKCRGTALRPLLSTFMSQTAKKS